MEPFVVAYRGRTAFACESRPPMSTRYLPFVRSMKSFNGQRLRTDAVAGVTVAALALPSAMAYAEIAGVPVSAGLYALLLPVVAYAVFGSAPRLVIGPEGTVSLLVASALAPLAATGGAEYAMLAAALAIFVGIVFFAARLMRLGWIADYSRRRCSSGTSPASPWCSFWGSSASWWVSPATRAAPSVRPSTS